MIFNKLKPVNTHLTYSTSGNVTPPICRVLIGQHLIFSSLTLPTCCNSPRKCTPVKHKTRQKARFQIVSYTTSQQPCQIGNFRLKIVNFEECCVLRLTDSNTDYTLNCIGKNFWIQPKNVRRLINKCSRNMLQSI